MRPILALSALSLCSSISFARPAVKVNLSMEINRVDKMIATLSDYEKNYWAIGLNGDSLKADSIVRFFADRDLSFKFFVRANSGVSLGEISAYKEDRQVLAAYRNKIIQDEIKEVEAIHADLEGYHSLVSAPGFNGEMPSVDKYLLYFSEERLPIHFDVSKGQIEIASESAFAANQKALDAYKSRLEEWLTPTASTPTP